MIKLALGMVMALSVLALTGEARAEQTRTAFQDGNVLYAVCASIADFDRGACLGYVEGVVDHLDWVRVGENKPAMELAIR